MGDVIDQKPVKLFMAITYKDLEIYRQLVPVLVKDYGEIELAYNYQFSTYSDHYHTEMGSPLQKTIVSFLKPVSKEKTERLKLYSNKLELEFADEESYPVIRRINIDPGYLTEAKVVLLTTKNFCHRVYIGQGIFAEIALTYRNKSFSANSWTYPDYRDEGVIRFFNGIRDQYRSQIWDL